MADLIDISPQGQATFTLAGAKARFYDAGTTTPRTVYSDDALTVPVAVPLVADANGLWPQVFVSGGAVKVVVTRADDSTGYTLDPVVKVGTSGSGAAQIGFAPATDIPATDVQAAIELVAGLPEGFGLGAETLAAVTNANSVTKGGIYYMAAGATNSPAVNLTGTYTRTLTAITVTITGGHGLATGNAVPLDFTTGGGTDGTYSITATGLTTFTCTDAASGTTSGDVTVTRTEPVVLEHFPGDTSSSAWQEAFGLSTGRRWARRKASGTWGAWAEIVPALRVSPSTDLTVDTTALADRATINTALLAAAPSRYASADTTVTINAVTNFAHGFGAAPRLVQVWLVCATAELGYSVGDLAWATNYDGQASQNGFGADTTNVFISLRASIAVMRKDTGLMANITPANWRWRVIAWR